MIAFLAFSISSCVGIYEDGFELANDNVDKVEQIGVAKLQSILDSEDEYVLIDVRQSNEYLLGNIPGSVNIPRGQLEFKINDENFWSEQYLYPPEKSTLIIIYCKSGNRGILAAKTLNQLGFNNVVNLEGGFMAFDPEFDESSATPHSSGGCGG
jgi:rhodanese-related sulfurtransferase